MKTLVLDGTAISIQVAMSGAAATTNPTFVATYADNAGSGITEGATDGVLNGSTDVTVVPAPTGTNRRVIKDITIYNGDTAAVTLFVKYDNNATQRTIAKATLAVGDTWTTDGVFDSNGNLKTVIGAVNLTTQVTGTLAVANGGSGATTLTGVLKGNGTSAFTAATAGTDYLAPPSGTAILKANSGGALANATAGTDYVAPGTATTFTATQTFSGSATAIAIKLTDAVEPATISATAATGTIAFDITTQSILYYTTNASGNFTMNLRGNGTNTLNSLMATGDIVTATFLNTNGATAYYNNVVQVDGTVTGVTTRWQGGAAPTAGNASSVDVYTYVITKTANATFSVFASVTRFA